MQLSSPPEVTIVLHPQESMSAATAYSSISLVVQFTRLYPHKYVFNTLVLILFLQIFCISYKQQGLAVQAC